MSRMRGLAVRAAAVAILLLIAGAAAAAIELGSWGVLRAKGKTTEAFGSRYSVPAATRYEPFVGYRYAPHAQGVRDGLGADRHGFIHNGDASRDLSRKAPGVFRIFLVGGSNVAGNGQAHETIAAQLEQRLNATGAPARVEVVNAGVSAWLASQDLALMMFRLPEFQPDLVVSFSGFTDVYQAIRAPHEGWAPGTNDHLVTQARAAYVHTYSIGGTLAQAFGLLRARSYAAEAFDEMRASLRARFADAAGPPAVPAAPGPDPLEPYRRNLALMAAVSQAQGVRFAAILQPTMLLSNSAGLAYREAFRAEVESSWSSIDFWGEKERLYREAREAFAALAAARDDGRTVIVRDYSAMFDREAEPAYLDQAHFTPFGNREIAAALARDLTPLLPRQFP